MPVIPATKTTMQVDLSVKERFIKQNAAELKRHNDRTLAQQDFLDRLMDLYDLVVNEHPELLPTPRG